MSGPEKLPSTTKSDEVIPMKDPRMNLLESEPGQTAEGAPLPGMAKESSGWDVYNNEAKKVDTELVLDWRASLNTLLLFAAIFAAVLTAFIIESKKMLEQDPTEVIMNVMILFTNNAANGIHTPYVPTEFTVPPHAVTVNSLFFASLSTSLLAALASVVSLQWVADYDAAITRGGSSPEDRARRRQFRYVGVISWKMNEIIASLPLLLYGSVILFLAGLMIWMWAVHYVVGLVVAGGAALAVLFYGISTFLAVAFVSAPFRTPLSRGVYIFIRLIISAFYLLFRTLHPAPVASRLGVAHKREDKEIEKRDELGMSSLVWLANHLSLSQDSYSRLLLLAKELPKLQASHLSTPAFKEAPWFTIFDILAWRHLESDESQGVSNQELQAVGCLAQCYQIPSIYEIISPEANLQYTSDTTDDVYWTQHLGLTRSQWMPTSPSTVPNSLFLLLRDIPMSQRMVSTEVQLIILMSRWRNSPIKKGTRNATRYVPTEQRIPADEASRYTAIVGRIVWPLVKSNGKMSPVFLDLLRLRYERILLSDIDMDPTHCLHNPSRYAMVLERLHPMVRLPPDSPSYLAELFVLHDAFTTLLARNLIGHPQEERARRVKELRIMLWAPVQNAPIFSIGGGSGMEDFFDRHNESITMGDLNRVPVIREVLHHIVAAESEQPELATLWRLSPTLPYSYLQFTSCLLLFDRLIGAGVTIPQHLKLIGLICRDLEQHTELSEGWPFEQDIKRGGPSDACLNFFFQYVGGVEAEHIHDSFTNPEKSWKPSWARIATMVMERQKGVASPASLQLQAAVWPALYHKSTDWPVLKDPELLSSLQRLYQYRVRCDEHYDYEGHLLGDILGNSRQSFMFPCNMWPLTAVSLRGKRINRVLAMLTLPNNQLVSLWDSQIQGQCWFQICKICESVKSSQVSLLALLCNIAPELFEDANPGEAAAFSICVNKGLDLPYDPRTALILPRLAHLLSRFRDMWPAHDPIQKTERDAAELEVTFAINRINTQLATVLVYGIQNRQILSCARTRQDYGPAIGWLPIHME